MIRHRCQTSRPAGAPRASALILALLGAVAPAGARPAPGETVERQRCLDDEKHSYALYLPSEYPGGRSWPVLIVMDPRGRALVPLESIRDSAEEYGYIVVSSYDTRSDGPREPNAAALKALLPEAERRFAADTRRIYLAGFSGTARAGWDFGLALPGHVAGLAGFGAGLPPGIRDVSGASLAFFGGAGVTDFNYQELRALDEHLDGARVAHRIRFYAGGHSWPPAAVFREALQWMEIQAMRTGLRPRSRPTLERIYDEQLATARELEARDDLLGAHRLYEAIVRDLDGLLPVAAAEIRARELGKSRAVRRARKRSDRIRREETAYQARFHDHLGRLRAASPPPPAAWSVEQLEIPGLLRRSRSGSDPQDSAAATRMLETVFVYTSFYEPEQLLRSGEAARALAMVEIAAAVKPGHPGVCYNRARAQAQIGAREAAMEALACSVEAGVPVSMVESDPYLEPLRGEPGYRDLIRDPAGSQGGER